MNLIETHVLYGGTPEPRRVHVPGRPDIGVVVDVGKNFGSGQGGVYCLGIHFPETGECLYYDAKRVTNVEK